MGQQGSDDQALDFAPSGCAEETLKGRQGVLKGASLTSLQDGLGGTCHLTTQGRCPWILPHFVQSRAETFTKWDAAEHLSTKEDMRFYLEACAEEDPGDGSLIRAALNDVARAQK